MAGLPTVKVMVLGGTITMAPGKEEGISPSLSGADLLREIPQLGQVANVEVHTPFLKPSASLELAELAQLIQGKSDKGKPNHAGMVIVQGTDTIDETSFFIDLLYDKEAPIVITGAMRGATALSADGPANLFAAVSTAASDAARGLGCLVVLNDEIHAAHAVEKMHKGLVSAFESPDGGPLGYFLENAVRMIRRPCARLRQALHPSRFPDVAIVKIGLGSTISMFDAVTRLGYEGVIVEGMGAGHVPERFAADIEKLSKTMPVVLASRVIGGSVYKNTYGFPGSEIDLIRRGVIPAEWLSPHKARLLLSVSLGAGLARDEIRQAFAAYGQP
ncbi:MAG: asparaginase [Burkholderiaceae bacterium]|nr:MAG: asparaginase [Burkholderiaceae bacterium]